MVAPCYIVVCNAFALTGRTRKTGVTKNPGRRFALPWAMRRLPFQGAQETQGRQVALFVPTSSAALGIAFKASLMLCSHLHEQSGRTQIKGTSPCDLSIWNDELDTLIENQGVQFDVQDYFYNCSKVSSSPLARTRTFLSCTISPLMIRLLRALRSLSWMARLTGRAPNCGS